MDFDFSDEQKMLADSAQRYVRDHCSLEARRAAAATADGFSRQHWATFAELGWLALPVPEGAGGLGGSSIDIAILMEQLGEGLVVEPFVDTAIVGTTLVAASHNAARRESLLGEIAAGECILALAHIEDGGRFEYDTPVNVKATPSGDGWKLSGTKQRVFHGGSADRWLVTARLGDAPGYAVFVVNRDTTGAKVDSYPLIDGTRAADITFADVHLDADALLLKPEVAKQTLEEAFDRAILAMTAAAIGSMEATMMITAEYLKTRVQYGKPLSQFQSLQHRMAEMFVETDMARSGLYRALAATEHCDGDCRRRAVSGLKAQVIRGYQFVTAQGIQLHGGIGVTEEYVIGHHYKAMHVYDKRFGDAAFHLTRSM